MCFVYVLGKGEAGQFIVTVGMGLCEGFLVAVSQSNEGAAPLTERRPIYQLVALSSLQPTEPSPACSVTPDLLLVAAAVLRPSAPVHTTSKSSRPAATTLIFGRCFRLVAWRCGRALIVVQAEP